MVGNIYQENSAVDKYPATLGQNKKYISELREAGQFLEILSREFWCRQISCHTGTK
jgi:hypothetical protein